MHPLEDIVREALGRSYAAPVISSDPSAVWVMQGKPLALAREAVRDAGHPEDVAFGQVLPFDFSRIGWRAVPPTGLRLWRQHGQGAPDGELVTEVEAGDPPLQVVGEYEGWNLARLADGATGWLEPDAAAGLGDESAGPGDLTRAVDLDAFAEVVEDHLGVPYVWGGTSRAGVDCSGLVQRAAWSAGGPWLPRHSTALLDVGARVGRTKVARGDVLVLRRHPGGTPAATTELPPHGGPARHPMHVAVVVDESTTVHASRDAWEVVREPIETLLERYRLLSARRLDQRGGGV